MNAYAADLWLRAREALAVASQTVALSPDAAASRAYYAAFYAVSALLALEEKEFTKHSAVESAVHRDLVKAGRWAPELGRDYSALLALREKGDYGGGEHATREEAEAAVAIAKRILDAALEQKPELEPGS